ncbi:MAG TPA: type II toxin-antitoxin system HicA family toxin [Candidatus Paceibacterota bacterium]
MSRLPQVNYRKVISALKRAGFEEYNQIGSHLILVNEAENLQTSIPIHSGDIGRGLLKKILKQAKISEEEFRKLL